MKRVKALGVIIMLSSCVCLAQRIQVDFYLEGAKQNIKDCEIYIVVNRNGSKVVYNPVIDSAEFQLPKFNGDTLGDIIFRHKRCYYGVGDRDLRISQSMRWVLGFDKRPFKQKYSASLTDDKTIKAIAYLENHPLERGEGFVVAVGVTNLRRYYRECKGLIH